MEAVDQQFRVFLTNATRSARGHYKAAEDVEKWSLRLGVPAAALSAVVATSIFATVASDPAIGWKIASGTLSLVAAVLVSLQTFFGHAERAREHRAVAGEYAALRRRAEVFRARDSLPDSRADEAEQINDLEWLRGRLDELGTSSPLIPPKSYQRAIEELAAEDAGSDP